MNESLNSHAASLENESNGIISCILYHTFIFILSFVIIACNSSVGSVNQNMSIKDTLKFTGCPEKIKAETGSIIEIKLEAVQATGHEWILKDSTLLIKLNKTDVLKYTANDEHSFQVLHFTAMKKGTELIHLEYRRFFEEEVVKSCDINVEII